MHGADAALLQPLLHAEVEVRGIDADEHIGLPRQHAPTQRAAQAQQTRQVTQYFGQAHHRQFAGIKPRVQACRAHCIAANAGEFGLGVTLA